MNVDLENKKEELNPTRFIKLSEILDDREKTLEELTQKAEEMQVQLWEDEKEIANLNMKIGDCYNAQIKINDEMGKTKKNFVNKERANEELNKKKKLNDISKQKEDKIKTKKIILLKKKKIIPIN